MNPSTAQEIPIEEIARYPLPGMAIPGKLAFSPDDRLITYLFSSQRDLTLQLYAFDPQENQHSLLVTPPEGGVTEANVSLEEALRRERQRQRDLGVTDYAWAKHHQRILVPAQGNIYTSEGPNQALRKIVSGDKHPALDPRFSPDGEWVAYVQDAELYIVAADGGKPRQLTRGARSTGKTHGLAEYIAQEEMKRSQGYWWSEDSRWLAFTEVDETHIPVYRIFQV